VDADVSEPLGVGLDRVEDRRGLAVGHPHDQVGVLGYEVQDRLG
jgi:hypothetical protein